MHEAKISQNLKPYVCFRLALLPTMRGHRFNVFQFYGFLGFQMSETAPTAAGLN
jgi:hypothetical protein